LNNVFIVIVFVSAHILQLDNQLQ